MSEALRVSVIERSYTVITKVKGGYTFEDAAPKLLEFVDDEQWRLDALDVALKHANLSRMNLDEVLSFAAMITEMAKVPDTSNVSVQISAPATRGRGRARKK